MNRERIIAVFFFAFLALIAYELYAILEPFLTPITWAILLAFIAHPALLALNRVIRSRSACALILTVVVALGVILPATWLSARIVEEVQSIYATLSSVSATDGLHRTSEWIRGTHFGTRLDLILAHHGIRLEDEIRTLGVQVGKAVSDYVLARGGAVATNVASFVFHFAIALLTFFYLLRDGEAYYEGVRVLTPLHEEDKAAVFETLRATLSSVMRGLMLTAVLDGFTLGFGYLMIGVPYWALLAILTAAAGLLPIGGTAIVWGPVAAYLWFVVGWGPAVVLVTWAAVTLAIIDNFVKPIAMRHGTGLPTLALFFGLAGGIEAYGPLGVFLGPAVVAVFASLLQVYQRTYVGAVPAATVSQVHPEPRRARRLFRR